MSRAGARGGFQGEGCRLVYHSVESARQLGKDSVVSPKFQKPEKTRLLRNRSPYVEECKRRSRQREHKRNREAKSRRLNADGGFEMKQETSSLAQIATMNSSLMSPNQTSLSTRQAENDDKIQLLVTPLPLSGPVMLQHDHSRRRTLSAQSARKRARAAGDRLRQSKVSSELALRGARTSLRKMLSVSPQPIS